MASPVLVHGELLCADGSGLGTEPTPEALAAGIARLLDDPRERAEFSRRVRERAAKRSRLWLLTPD
jgi:glycosyltransferase involved in cell wall biosynthesis